MVSSSPTNPNAPPATERRWYKSIPLIAGLVLIALGVGNWITGATRTADYARQIEEFVPAPSRGGVSGKRLSAEELQIAQVRMDFYHVVASGGRFMTMTGVLLATFGLARSLRPPARRRT